jgi:hypothetical protein
MIIPQIHPPDVSARGGAVLMWLWAPIPVRSWLVRPRVRQSSCLSSLTVAKELGFPAFLHVILATFARSSIPTPQTKTGLPYTHCMAPALDPVLAKLARRGLVTVGPALAQPHLHHLSRRNLSVNHTQAVTLGVIAAYVVIIALLWNLPYVRWVLWPFKVSPDLFRTRSNGPRCFLRY